MRGEVDMPVPAPSGQLKVTLPSMHSPLGKDDKDGVLWWGFHPEASLRLGAPVV